MKEKSSGYSTISECQRNLLMFWLGGIPNPVPHMSEWGYFLPVFRERIEDNLAQHLFKFHQCMDQLDFYHEDVLMKILMHSLDGDAHQWYFSLPHSSISSLKKFHSTFKKHYKGIF
jgi:hypothetical protein